MRNLYSHHQNSYRALSFDVAFQMFSTPSETADFLVRLSFLSELNFITIQVENKSNFISSF